MISNRPWYFSQVSPDDDYIVIRHTERVKITNRGDRVLENRRVLLSPRPMNISLAPRTSPSSAESFLPPTTNYIFKDKKKKKFESRNSTRLQERKNKGKNEILFGGSERKRKKGGKMKKREKWIWRILRKREREGEGGRGGGRHVREKRVG